MKKIKLFVAALSISAFLTTSVPVMAQTADTGTTTSAADNDDDDDNGKLGLLGLLGLAGLLGLRKKDDDRTRTNVNR